MNKNHSQYRNRSLVSGIDRRTIMKGALAGGAAAFSLSAPGQLLAQPRKTIKIGLVTPKSGPLAPFAAADDFVIGQLGDVLASGVSVDGRNYPITLVVKDTQSNPRRAAEVAAELIHKDQVDLLIAAGTSDTTNPVADQAEANATPCITTDTPWQAHFFGRRGDPKKPFEWTYHFFWGLEQISNVYTGIWDLKSTNKIVGSLWSNDPDGAAIRKGINEAVAAKGGFKMVDTGFFAPGSNDFTAQIFQLKAANVDIVTGLFLPPDFSTFWIQAAQQGLRLVSSMRERSDSARLTEASISSAVANRRSPIGVKVTPVVRRSKSFPPRACSSAPMRRPTVAWSRLSRRPAATNCPARATARKTRT